MPLNRPQQLFLAQAQSDDEIYRALARRDVRHRLHYLQMCTEKLSKVYFWRLMNPPTGGHSTFIPFLRILNSLGRTDVHKMFGYISVKRFNSQWQDIWGLAQKIQDLAPGPSNPNPEYPWPRNLPTDGPLNHPDLVHLWREWSTTIAGRRLKFFVENLVRNYLVYFP